MNVFWSWQDDLSAKHNRFFVRDALLRAIDAAGQSLGLDEAERPKLDHDTKGEPGMVEIASTIFRKISEAAVFVADVTPIAQSDSRKAIPNPNVLIELGWAMNVPGPDRIIPVLNTSYGFSPEDLPFDLRHRRILRYELSEDADRATTEDVKKRLVEELEYALRVNLGSHLENTECATEISGVDQSPENPTFWAGFNPRLTHQDPDKPGQEVMIQFRGVFGYIRIIPEGWKGSIPSVASIGQIPCYEAFWPPTKLPRYRGHGAADRGYIRYNYDQLPGQQRVQRTATDAIYFFEENGEFWIRLDDIVNTSSSVHTLDKHMLLNSWSEMMRGSFAFFDQFNAKPLRKVQVGLFGMKGVRWSAENMEQSPVAINPAIK